MKIDSYVGGVHIKLDSKRMDKNLGESQKKLNMQVVADCTPLIPFQQGALRGSVNYPQGIYGGEIEWDAPHAHAIYEGYIFEPNIPIKDSEGNITGWFSPPGKKKQKTDRKMHFHTPGTTDHFFEVAKKQHKNDWVKLVKETAGKR